MPVVGMTVIQGWLIKTGKDGFQRGQQTIGADLVKHLANPIWLRTSLGNQVALAELDKHPFCTGGDEAAAGGDEQLVRSTGRGGGIEQFSGAGLEILDDLLHELSHRTFLTFVRGTFLNSQNFMNLC
jgi:hypothetical protein